MTRTTFTTFTKVSTCASLFCLYSLAIITSATLFALTPAYTKHVGQAFQARVGHTRVQQQVPPSVVTYPQYASTPLVRTIKVKPAHCVLGHNQTGIQKRIIQPEELWVKRIQVGT
jgi:hypothetical protein